MSKITKLEKEIIKKEIERLKREEREQYEFIRNHEKCYSRREFMGVGLLGGFTALASSSILGFLTQPAFASEAQCASSGAGASSSPGFFQIELAGGACTTGSIIPKTTSGGLLSSAGYAHHGYANAADPNNNAGSIKKTFGFDMHEGSPLYQAMITQMGATAEELEGLFQGVLIATRSENDRAGNPLTATQLINQIKGQGSIAGILGTNGSANGLRSVSAGGDPTNATRIANENTIRQLVDLGPLLTRMKGSEDRAKKILNAIKTTSSRKLASFNKKSVSDQLKILVECGYVKANESVFEDTPDNLLPSNDAQISAAFGQNPTGADLSHAGITKLVLDGKASSGGIVLNGFDYHNRVAVTQDRGKIIKDYEAGEVIGKIFRAAREKGVPCVVAISSDGGASSEANGAATGAAGQTIRGGTISQGFITAAREDASVSSLSLIAYSPNGFKEAAPSNTQIGGYNQSSGQIERNAASVSNNNQNAVVAVAANYLALTGQLNPKNLSDACNKVGLTNPYDSEAKLNEVRKMTAMN